MTNPASFPSWGRIGVLFLILCCTSTLVAQEQDTSTVNDKTIGILPVPAFGYTPETRGYVGAVALVTTDFYKNDSTRISNGKVEVNYTQNRQWIFSLGYEHYFPNDDHILTTSAAYLLFPEYFYGIGNSTELGDEELYESRRFEWFVNFEQRLEGRFFAGLLWQGQGLWDVDFPDTSIYDERSVPGFNGGLSSGAGYSLRFDNRDAVLNATKGWLVQWQQTIFDDLIGSQFSFQRFRLDIRKFQRLTKSTILAFQVLGQFHSDDPPMRMLSLMGGDQAMRGYYTGRFRDRQMITMQVEARQSLFWRIGIAAFAGMGKVGDDLSDLYAYEYKPSYGGGLRFRVDDEDNINLRFDFARGRDVTGFYVAFGEAF